MGTVRPTNEESGVKHVEGSASGITTASVDECLDLVRRLDDYPSWHHAVVRTAQVRERDADGLATRADATLRVQLAEGFVAAACKALRVRGS
jgi:hypothetical protein